MSADAGTKEEVAKAATPQAVNEGAEAPQLGPDGQPIQSKSAGKLGNKRAFSRLFTDIHHLIDS